MEVQPNGDARDSGVPSTTCTCSCESKMEHGTSNKYKVMENKYRICVEERETMRIKMESMKREHEDTQKAYEEMKRKLDELNPEVLEQALGPFREKYAEVHNLYEIEKACRRVAEGHATKVEKKNKQINRQSRMLIQHMNLRDIDIDEIMPDMKAEEEEETGEEEEVAKLSGHVTELETQITELRADLTNIKEEKLALEEKHRRDEEEFDQLRQVSTVAYTDFQRIQEELEQEKVLRATAEQYARKMLKGRELAVRQSSALVMHASQDENARQLLVQLESLQETLSEKETHYKLKIEEYEEELSHLRDSSELEQLKAKLSLVIKEVDLKEGRIADLSRTMAQVTTERDQLKHALVPRAPPPPPPPGPIAGILKAFRKPAKNKIDKSKKIIGKEGTSTAMDQAIKEMMDRIQKGKLRGRSQSTTTPAEDSKSQVEAFDPAKTFQNLNGVLKTLELKRTRSEANVSTTAPCSELQKRFDRINQREKSIDEELADNSSSCSNTDSAPADSPSAGVNNRDASVSPFGSPPVVAKRRQQFSGEGLVPPSPVPGFMPVPSVRRSIASVRKHSLDYQSSNSRNTPSPSSPVPVVFVE